jgi:steroid delta-isomerase-like uncharacterized protein
MKVAMSASSLEANKALVLAHYDAVTNRHDPDAIRTQVSPDFFDHAANAAMSADDVIAHFKALHATFGEMNASVETIIAEGDIVAARVVWRGVHRGPWRGIAPTDKRIEFRGMMFWRIRDNRIAERWAEVDFASLEKQLKG